MAKITLKNGIVISDVPEKTLKALISGLEDGEYYNSETKGRLRIEDMETNHLKNAVLKMLREEVEEIRQSPGHANFVASIKAGIGSKNVTLVSMVNEIDSRLF